MTDLDHGNAPHLPGDNKDVSPNYDQMTKASLISQGPQRSPALPTLQQIENNVHTVETEEASIKFVGGVIGSFSESDSEEEQENCTSHVIKSNSRAIEVKKDDSNSKISNVKLKYDRKEQDTRRQNNDTILTEQALSGIFNTSDKLYSKIVNRDTQENLRVSDRVNKNTVKSEISHIQSTSTPSKSSLGENPVNVPTGVTLSPVRTDLHNKFNESAGSDSTDEISPHRPTRFNPFDRDVVFEEDHFATPEAPSSFETCRDYVDSLSPGLRHGRHPQSFSSASDSFSFCSPEFQDEEFSFADLGLAEDHFSRPEGHFGMSTLEELEMAMENCKDMIRDAPQNSDKQKTLVRKLVQLRIKYQEYKEGPEVVEDDVKLVVGHRFQQKDSRSSKHYCEKCNAVIWGMLQVWYRCTECGYHCHEKCLNQITRTCASVRVADNPSYILSICPERGLASQNYRCAECRSQISFKSGFSEPRLCDYSGNYYCELCHWNDVMIIPARVLHNWDFQPQKVCRAAKQFLRLMTNRAVLRIQDINPMLFNFVEELDDVKKLREEILIMKKYFLSCKSALESKLLLQLSPRQHCVENSDMYSIKDLVDVQADVLLPELAKVHSSFAQHIKSDCQLCQAKGFICELCDTHEVLFPFDNIAVVCAQCSYVLHRHCFVRKDNQCPRCERRNKRNEVIRP